MKEKIYEAIDKTHDKLFNLGYKIQITLKLFL